MAQPPSGLFNQPVCLLETQAASARAAPFAAEPHGLVQGTEPELTNAEGPVLAAKQPVGRLVHKADFERLLATRSRTRSAHFAVHHVAGAPTRSRPARLTRLEQELSTVPDRVSTQSVDKTAVGCWLGCLVPKRHARRSVTRSLLKRHMRQIFESRAPELPTGLWLVRLSQGFPLTQFHSAASRVLSTAARLELAALLADVQRRLKTP